MSKYDLIIRGGSVVDGTGGAPFRADVAIRGAVIAAVGDIQGNADEEIDANGMLVTPGFVDIHTHYDGQATWESRTLPSSAHGVTTVMTGNCGVGFAPCRPADREILVRLMEGIEDIPEVVMTEGLSWDWESFPQFLDVIDARPRDIDIATQLPHSCLRVFVMGERGAAGERATPADLAVMARLSEEAMRAGALGFGTSRSLFHRSSDGKAVPTKDAQEEELKAIASGLKAAGHGVIQAIFDVLDEESLESGVRLLGRVAGHSGRPVSYTLVQLLTAPRDAWREALRVTGEINRSGVSMKAQVFCRPVGVLLGLELSFNPFVRRPTYVAMASMPLADRVARLRRPEVRKAILSESPVEDGLAVLALLTRFDLMFVLGEAPNYEPAREESIAARAARAGISAEEMAYDLLLEQDGKSVIILTAANYNAGNLDDVRDMLTDPNTLYGLGDGGAHYGMICDGSYPTFALTYWTRDRQTGAKLSLPDVVRGLSHDTAAAIGLHDRGIIAPGYKADINIIDYSRLKLHPPRVVRDLPANGKRLIQDAEGFVATIVSGCVIQREGQPTDLLPGKLIRGPKSAPLGARA